MNCEVRTNSIGYHVNDKKRCLKFIEEENYLIISEDVFWLGWGMYFWDNAGNAKYWLEQKTYKNKNDEYTCTKSNIYTDEEFCLDLTDNETRDLVKKLWENYCTLKKEKREQPLGIKIDKLINFFDILEDTKVVRGIGDYNIEQKKKDVFRFNEDFKGPQIRGDLKIIYCVRCPKFVISRRDIGGLFL
ncbi:MULTISPECIES: hypothetical protein [Clostridium]|uniref:hypothetical protein n=1 Tax=Clostridium TaxID=1485 RepID=UPI0005FBBD96|nr:MULTISPECIES: hypothetical protein [Clostridium]CAI3619779.1 conserved hypothetical protein [Clostridium neonatale]KJZ91057.1 hypothetical protein ClosIBUN13A_CONTIG238g03730 [Clostridium sp. IBUN13A]MDU1071525.1 hypothetical protein [Clostridium sp.]MDU2679493.1 hypothetical protein [Clostridium sp.]MDU4214030.1 hypothetical protein [Clostridium sp.]